MNDPINPAIVEKAAKAMADDWNPERDPILTAMFRDYAQTALEAVADDIRAEALREAADALDAYDIGNPPPDSDQWDSYLGYYGEAAWLRNRADQIEHDARCPHPKCPGGSLCCCADQIAGADQ